MNKNQAKGSSKVVLGKLQRGTGKLTGSRRQEVRGLAKQAAGRAQKRLGDVQEVLAVPRKGGRRR